MRAGANGVKDFREWGQKKSLNGALFCTIFLNKFLTHSIIHIFSVACFLLGGFRFSLYGENLTLRRDERGIGENGVERDES